MTTPRSALLAALHIYKKFFSAGLRSSCRFTPTCSDYASEAIERHDALLGALLALRRIMRCNPLFRGGLDLVPLREKLDLAPIGPCVALEPNRKPETGNGKPPFEVSIARI